MPITINTKHAPGKSIQEIYLELVNESTNVVDKKIGAAMLKFIEMVDSIFPKTRIWALTSHYTLVLQADDDWKSDWFIKVGCLGEEYYIEYLMSDRKRPWPQAYVQGVARGISEAQKYLLIAMKECGAWQGNGELMKSLEE